MSDEPEADTPAKRRVDKGLLFISFVIAIGLVLIGRGLLVGVTGDDRSDLPSLIERVEPVPEAVQVLSQTGVFVDLASGYTGILVIDDVEIETVNVDDLANIDTEPGQQVEVPEVTIYESGNATLTFTPSDDAPIQKFGSGEHRVKVIFWRIDEGPERPRSYSWTFNVV